MRHHPYLEMVQARLKVCENAALAIDDQAKVYIPLTIRPDVIIPCLQCHSRT